MLLHDVVDLVWPARCAGCGGVGSPWCSGCALELAGCAFRSGPLQVRPAPAPVGLPPVLAWGPYAGSLRTAIVAYKDRERRDLACVLGPLLAPVVAATLLRPEPGEGQQADRTGGASDTLVLVVPVPSSAAAVRRRGDRPLERLGRLATGLLQPTVSSQPLWSPCLRTVRKVGDQAGLRRAARSANLQGAFAIAPRWRTAVQGARCVIIDDVVTTGATLAETARALRSAGASVMACATLAATARHAPVGRRTP